MNRLAWLLSSMLAKMNTSYNAYMQNNVFQISAH